jgi:hypothetical protein
LGFQNAGQNNLKTSHLSIAAGRGPKDRFGNGRAGIYFDVVSKAKFTRC